MSIRDIRRKNLGVLAKSIGGVVRLAERLDKAQSQISQLIGRHPMKNIGDKLSKEVEVAFNKPPGWLDRAHGVMPEALGFYAAEDQSCMGALCSQIPLITWEEAKCWPQIAHNYNPNTEKPVVPTTVEVSIFSFALHIYGDSMEAPGGLSFPEDAIIIADPDAVAKPDSFVIAMVGQDRGATFKQLIVQGSRRYLKPLNPRYPILECTLDTVILGVVKQMVINFHLA